MKSKFILSVVVLALGLSTSPAIACNCGKKSVTGNQAASCQCGSSCTETACPDSSVKASQSATVAEMNVSESTAVDSGNKICPVSGKPVGSMGAGVTAAHNGKIYHLCCSGCLDKFRTDAETYLKNMNDK